MNTCKRCNIIKPWLDFYKASNTKSGYSNTCKLCIKLSRKSRAGCESTKEYNRKYQQENGTELSKRYFSRDYRFTQLKRYHDNKVEINAKAKLVRCLPSYKANHAAKEARRRFRKFLATPNWLSRVQLDQMNYTYQVAKDASLITGESYHVDHIIPLKSKNVCGLHVPWNLQVLPSDLNLSKSNKFQG